MNSNEQPARLRRGQPAGPGVLGRAGAAQDSRRHGHRDQKYHHAHAEKYTKKSKKPDLVKPEEYPRLYTLIKNSSVKSRREINLEKHSRLLAKNYSQVLSAGNHVFGVTVSLLQLLSSLKESSKPELAEAIETYKLQLSRYHKVLVNEGSHWVSQGSLRTKR